MDILIVKPKWVERIFSYNKIWEIRGSDTKKRGLIEIAESGTSLVVGTVNLIGTTPLTKELWETNEKNHQVDLSWEELLKIYPKPYAWIFETLSAKRYDKPVPYVHPKGAVIWVKG